MGAHAPILRLTCIHSLYNNVLKPIENINDSVLVAHIIRRETGLRSRQAMYAIFITMMDGKPPYYCCKPQHASTWYRGEYHLRRTIRTHDVSWLVDQLSTEHHEVFIESYVSVR